MFAISVNVVPSFLQRLHKLIYLDSFTDCFMKISLQLSEQIQIQIYSWESYNYAGACPPATWSAENNRCLVHIHSPHQSATVSISTIINSTTQIILQGQVYTQEFREEYFPTGQSESLAIRIRSDVPVQVLVEKSDSFASFFNDVYQALEWELSGLEYFTQAYIPNIKCSGSYYKQFFSVVSFFDDTIFEVASADGV